jgi:hypothetical protein
MLALFKHFYKVLYTVYLYFLKPCEYVSVKRGINSPNNRADSTPAYAWLRNPDAHPKIFFSFVSDADRFRLQIFMFRVLPGNFKFK